MLSKMGIFLKLSDFKARVSTALKTPVSLKSNEYSHNCVKYAINSSILSKKVKNARHYAV